MLHRDPDGKPFDRKWNYRSIIGKLNFLEKSTRPELAFAVHQAARFAPDPKVSHARAVSLIGRYLVGTKDLGMTFSPDPSRGLEVYSDADFCGLWHPSTAMEDKSTAKSRSGYVILFAGCPITWSSKLQTEIALSSTESEYTCLSEALRTAIPLLRILEELQQRKYSLPTTQSTIRCTLFEDNDGAAELAKVPKTRPRTRHLNTKYHNFREFVKNVKLLIKRVDTLDQIADIFTKPLPTDLFRKFRRLLLGQ